MDEDRPFLAVSRAMRSKGLPAVQAVQARAPDATGPDVPTIFEASVTGVQTGFKHLSRTDIAHPPHQWFDAMLARQIAIHIAVRRHHVALRRIARELDRNKGSVLLALKAVDRRLANEKFGRAYEDMAEQVEAALRAEAR